MLRAPCNFLDPEGAGELDKTYSLGGPPRVLRCSRIELNFGTFRSEGSKGKLVFLAMSFYSEQFLVAGSSANNYSSGGFDDDESAFCSDSTSDSSARSPPRREPLGLKR